MSSGERNTEIWSTRLQRELLAMTTDNATDAAKEEMTAVLPSFCVIKEHALDIERGNCTVTCWMDLAPSSSSSSAKAAEAKAAENENRETVGDDGKEKADAEAAAEGSSTEAIDKEDTATTDTDANETELGVEEPAPILVTLDLSLQKKSDGSVDATAVSYPFLKPFAMLTSGCNRFPEGSTIKDGDCIDIELDWTPSLHLTDALLNVSLKIKECISQGEPFHAGTTEMSKTDVTVGDMMNRAKKIGSSFSQSLRGLTENKSGKNAGGEKKNRLGLGRKKTEKKPKPRVTNPSDVRIGDEINMLEAPWVDCQGVYSCKAIRRPNFVEEAIAAAAQQMKSEQEPQVSSAIFGEDVDQGEVPDDFGDYMRLQAGGMSQVASAGLAGAGAMLRSFTTTARSVLEESFFMITETHIIEMRSNKLNLSSGTVTFAIPIEMLGKLKFRRQESVSLFFKPAPDDPLIYMCPDSADCVHQIQAVLKRHGVKGKHTNAATHRAINQALLLVQEIQTKELALKHDPSVERVNEIMDLYRQAAERFEVAGDVRHEEVVTHMRKFLALPLTIGILDGSYQKPSGDQPISTTSGEGIVLTTPKSSDELDASGENVSGSKSKAADDDKTFEASMDSILREAEADLANMKIPDDDDPELDAMLDDGDFGGSADDAIADFENMLKEADNELAELMNS